jgi:hypothetical protein
MVNQSIVETKLLSQTGSFDLGRISDTIPLKLTDIRIANVHRVTLAIGDLLFIQKLV